MPNFSPSIWMLFRKDPSNMKKRTYISVTISGDKEIQKLNKKYLKKDRPTDVLSFNINQEMKDGTFYLGDVVVNKEQAKRQAGKGKNGVEKEISELVAHGVLHLLGVHHEEGLG